MNEVKGRRLWSVISMALIIVALSAAVAGGETNGPAVGPGKGSGGMEILVVVDNNPFMRGLDNPWGFSCIVRGTEKTILFDTGPRARCLLDNMKKMQLEPQKVDVVVLSHIHQDHTGGLMGFLKENHEVAVYLPKSFPKRFKEDVAASGASVVEVGGVKKICDRVYTTGELEGPVREQSLVIRTDRGSIVITGCAHPGIVKILKKAGAILKEDLLLAMGGFHLTGMVSEGPGSSKLKGIVSAFKTLGVRYAGPCHCSGDGARRLFKRTYKEYYLEIGAGKVIKVNDLK